MDRMSHNIAVPDDIVLFDSLAIDLHTPVLDGPYIKFIVPVPKLGVEDFDQGTTQPATFSIGLILEKVRVDLAEV